MIRDAQSGIMTRCQNGKYDECMIGRNSEECRAELLRLLFGRTESEKQHPEEPEVSDVEN